MARKPRRERALFVCGDCGREEAQWSGRCPACGAWDSMREAPSGPAPSARSGPVRSGGGAQPLAGVDCDECRRHSSGLGEVDRVLGGGLVPGSVTLLGGEPGVGKSTLLLQMASAVAGAGGTALYASGEESPRQVRLRAERTGCLNDGILVLGTTDVDEICVEAERLRPALLVVDSIQTMMDSAVEGVPGSPSQIRAAALRLLTVAKGAGIPTILVGHVTKDGEIAGPKLLEHMVDTVLSFEGDPQRVYRFLRAVKNRFGAVSEVGVFVMEGRGLEGVANPSSLFIHRASLELPGACLAPVVVGTRSYVVEVQGLVTENNFSFGRRIAQGYDLNRLNLILSVLEKRLGLPMGRHDVCLNVTGGLQVREPALDLAVAVAVLSSHGDRPVPVESAWSGEVGLSGEIRPVYHLEQRAEEARRVGCRLLVAPEGAVLPPAGAGKPSLEVRAVGDLTAVARMLVPQGGR